MTEYTNICQHVYMMALLPFIHIYISSTDEWMADDFDANRTYRNFISQ